MRGCAINPAISPASSCITRKERDLNAYDVREENRIFSPSATPLKQVVVAGSEECFKFKHLRERLIDPPTSLCT